MEILPKLVTKEKVINNFENEKQYSNWISNKLKRGTYVKIRNNLYALIDPSTNDIYSTRFEIASNITNTSFICYHSALEYYGIANQVFNDITVGTLTKFNNFTFNDIEFHYKSSKNIDFVDYVVREEIRVTSLERTIIDCIDDINLSGGVEEVLNALEQIKYLNEGKLLEILMIYNKMFLYQKVGYLFEIYNFQLKLSNNFFDTCKSNLTSKVNYFLKDEFDNLYLNRDWNLFVPQNIRSRINGGY